jgi:hypothetical protein
MLDEYTWSARVTQRCPLYITELEREAMVEWVVEQAETDYGSIQVEYTRCEAIERPFVCESVSASVWSLEIDESLGDEVGTFVLEKVRHDFHHIGLAKRWAAALSELLLVDDANLYLKYGDHPDWD